jgi:hypothetical protein
MPVTDVYPQRLPDLFDGKPLVVTGRYTAPLSGSIRLKGKRAGEDFVRDIPVSLSVDSAPNSVLPGFWARRRIDDLTSQDWSGAQSGNIKPALQKEITRLGLDYGLMTQFTSFVAVEDRVVAKDGKPQRVEVPVEMPEGVSYEGVFGRENKGANGILPNAGLTMYSSAEMVSSVVAKPSYGGGRGAGVGAGVAGGAMPSIFVPPKGVVAQSSGPPTAEVLGAGDSSARGSRLSPARKVLESKLQPALLAAFDCAKQQGHDCKLVHNGRVEIEVWTTKRSVTLLDKLKMMEFEAGAEQSGGKVLVGLLSVEKLRELAQLAEVQFVSTIRK